MNASLLSIVVPLYNVELYLERFLRSILDQTYREIEVILVNDGSTDATAEICGQYARLDRRVRLLSQENQGAAIARRNGARLASGRYMATIDPDDYVDRDFYEQLMACRGDFDVVIAQWLRESDRGTRRCGDTIRPGAYSTPEDMDFLLRHLINVSLPGGAVNIQPGIAAYFWNKLFKTELIREVMEELSAGTPNSNEDRPITYGVMLRCRSVLLTEICGYHYCIRSDSLAHTADQSCDYVKSACQLYSLVAPMFAKHPRRDSLMAQLQLKTAEDLSRGPAKMGFPDGAQLQLKTPVFPFVNLLEGKRVVLYGAGPVGCSYRRQIQKWNACEIVLWTDENWDEYARAGLPVEPVERVREAEYDRIIIAAPDRAAAQESRQRLTSMGAADSRILWRAPLELY